MSFWDITRGPASVLLLLEFGGDQGLEPTRLLAGSRLTLAQLNDPNCLVTSGQELIVIENLLHLSRQTAGLGLQVGLRYHLAAFGILGYGLMCSATGANAMALAQQYLPLTYTFATVTRKQVGDLEHLYFAAPEDLEPAVQRFVVERAMAGAARLMHDVIGDSFVLSALRMRYRDSQKTAPSPQIFGATLELGANDNVLSFSHHYMQQELLQANPITVAMCRQMCVELIDQRRSQLGTAALVRQYLECRPNGQLPSLSEVARLLNTSERTLKRWLQSEGTSFREMLTSSRMAKAGKLLADDQLTLTEVAEVMGFSDLSTFSQAYKRWTGIAPSAARKAKPSENT